MDVQSELSHTHIYMDMVVCIGYTSMTKVPYLIKGPLIFGNHHFCNKLLLQRMTSLQVLHLGFGSTCSMMYALVGFPKPYYTS